MSETLKDPRAKHKALPEQGNMSFLDHLDELRTRLIYAITTTFCTSLIAFTVHEVLLGFILVPYKKVLGDKATLQAISPLESFFVTIKISIIGGIFIASPILLFQVWKFISPALYQSEKKLALPFVFLTTLFFIGGATFGYFVVFPMVIDFLASFSFDLVTTQFSLEKYVSFSIFLLLIFGILFEFPIFLLVLLSIGIIKRYMLTKYRTYFYIGSFVLGAFLTPPDIISQSIVAAVLIIFYESTLLIAKVLRVGT